MASFKKMIVNDTDYDVDDPNDVETEGGELADTVINYDSATTPTIGSFTQFLDRFTSGTKVGAWFKNFRAGCDFLLHIGSLVNNCVSDNETLPLAASQGKVLMDLITEANSLIDTLQEKETELNTALATAQSDIASINNDLSDLNSELSLKVDTPYSAQITGAHISSTNPEIVIDYSDYYSCLIICGRNSEVYCCYFDYWDKPCVIANSSNIVICSSDNKKITITQNCYQAISLMAIMAKNPIQ